MLCFTAEEAWLSRYPRRRRLGASRTVPGRAGDWRDDALAEKWRKVRARAPRRHRRARDRARRKAHRLLARGRARSSMSPTRTCSRRWSTSISPRSASPRPRRWSKARGRRRRSASTTCRASRSCAKLAEGRNARAPGKSRTRVGTDPEYPDVTPRDAQALREWDAHAQGGGVNVLRAYALGPAHRASAWRRRRSPASLDQASKLWLLDRVRSRRPRHRASRARSSISC